MSRKILTTKCITKSYNMKNNRLEVLKGIDIEIVQGDAVCIRGSSGAGKSTLLHILGTLDRPSFKESLLQGRRPYSQK